MRKRTMQLRMSDTEVERLTDLAEALGLSMSAALRYALHRTAAVELAQLQLNLIEQNVRDEAMMKRLRQR